ncbi:MAG: SatD family protein [Candidatus Delongbacteria bacterium]
MNPVVLIADLVRSRDIPERAQFQKRLSATLQALSVQSAESLLSPYTLTLGDEFQAVHADFRRILPDCLRILAELAPVRARFALAAGPLSTEINPVAALEMDGPAFLRARELLGELKTQSRNVIQVGWAEGADPGLVNAALGLLAGTMEGWKPVTLRLFRHLLDGRSVDEMAALLGMTPRGVYKHIAGRHLQEARTLLKLAGQELDGRLGREAGEGREAT